MGEEWRRRGYLCRAGTKSRRWKRGTAAIGPEKQNGGLEIGKGQENRGKRTGRKEKPWNCDQSQVRDGEGGNRGKQERNNERKFRNKLDGSALNTAGIMNWETERDCAETLVPKLTAWSTSHWLLLAGKGWGAKIAAPQALAKLLLRLDELCRAEVPCTALGLCRATEHGANWNRYLNPKTAHMACKGLAHTWPSS